MRAFRRTLSLTKVLLHFEVRDNWKALVTCLSTAQYRVDPNRILAKVVKNKHSTKSRVKGLPPRVAKTILETYSYYS
jgi:hypothetical protein